LYSFNTYEPYLARQLITPGKLAYPMGSAAFLFQPPWTFVSQSLFPAVQRGTRHPQEWCNFSLSYPLVLQREIASTYQAIDALVYQLYGLTEAEIKIVEVK
jgi:hypothetical protein